MTLKKLAIGAVAALGIVAAPTQASAQIDNKMIQQIAIMLLAEKLGIDSGGILGALGGSTGADIFGMAPAIAMQQYAPTYTPQQIYQLRQTMPWDQVATRVGIPQDRYVVLRNSGNLDPNSVWRNTYQTKFGLNQSQVNRLREMGFNWEQIGRTAVIAREAGVSIFNVAARYQQWHNWNTVAQHYKVSNSTVSRRVASWRQNRAVPTTWQVERISPTWRNEVVRPTTWRAQPIKKTYSTTKSHPSSNGKKLGHYKNKAKGKAKGHGKH
ncbi:MAG: hypothetical protein ACAH95_02545 [Fimbriimonas sp.]